jgi:hypothetical protein
MHYAAVGVFSGGKSRLWQRAVVPARQPIRSLVGRYDNLIINIISASNPLGSIQCLQGGGTLGTEKGAGGAIGVHRQRPL